MNISSEIQAKPRNKNLATLPDTVLAYKKHHNKAAAKMQGASEKSALDTSHGKLKTKRQESSDSEDEKPTKPATKPASTHIGVKAAPAKKPESCKTPTPKKPATKPASTHIGVKAAPAKKPESCKTPTPKVNSATSTTKNKKRESSAPKKRESSSDDSDDSDDEKTKVNPSKPTPAKPAQVKRQKSSSDSDSSDEEPKKAQNPVQKQNTSVRATPKVQNEKSSDDSDDSDNDTTKKAPQKPASKPRYTPSKTGAKAAPAKKLAPAKKHAPAKKPESSSDDSDDSSDEKSKVSKQAKQTKYQVKPSVSKEKSSSDEDSDEPPKQKKTVQKSQQNYTKAASKVPFIMMFSSDDSDDSSEDEKPKTNKTPIKTVPAKVLSTKSSSDSDDCSEDGNPKKRLTSATPKSKAKVLSDDASDAESNQEPTDDDSDDSDYQPPAKVQKRETKRGECHVCHATLPLSRLRNHLFFCLMRASDDMFESIGETSSSEEGSIDVKAVDGDEDAELYGPPQHSPAKIAPDACLICLRPYVSPTDSIHCGRVYCEVCWLQYLRDKKICLQCRAATIPQHLDKTRLEHFTYSSKCDVQIVYTRDDVHQSTHTK